jgi:hypothetical protein
MAEGGSKRDLAGTGRKTGPSEPRRRVILRADVPARSLFEPPSALRLAFAGKVLPLSHAAAGFCVT